jgi:hypothetical protein
MVETGRKNLRASLWEERFDVIQKLKKHYINLNGL